MLKRSDFSQVVVAIDPAVTSGEESDSTGIIAVARGPHQPDTCKLTGLCPGHGYVLGDYTCRLPPAGWAVQAIAAFDKWRANRMVAEVNNGGDMVGDTIRAIRSTIPYEPVRATKGKWVRAEPVSSLYEQGRVHHLGNFLDLEEEMTTWSPDSKDSPDRMDAMVWGLTSLGLIGQLGDLIFAEAMVPDRIAGRAILPVNADRRWAGHFATGLDFDQEDNGKLAESPFA